MNTIEQILHHTSCRNFDPDFQLSDDVLNSIIDASKMAATTLNGQFYSIIILRGERKKQFADLIAESPGNANNAKCIHDSSVFLMYCIDFSRVEVINSGNFHFGDDTYEVLSTGIIDCSLALQNAVVASESLDLGTLITGGIRSENEKIIKFFNLPKYVFPLVGLLIGKRTKEMNVKPRLPQEINVFEGAYKQFPDIEKRLQDYSDSLNSFASYSNYSSEDWIIKFKNYFSKKFYPKDTKDLLKKQGLI